jgi:exodeoxyribonuclease-3
MQWLAAQEPDVLCLQEVRATDEQLAQVVADAGLGEWAVAHTEAAAKGHAGVAVLSRQQPLDVRYDGRSALAGSGRWVEVDLATATGPLTVVSAYVHAGEAGTPRQDEKHRFLDAMSARCGASPAGGTASPWSRATSTSRTARLT